MPQDYQSRKEYFADYHIRNTERRSKEEKARRYLRDYGLTLEQWDALFESQGRRCAICRTSDSGTKLGWDTDHDHTTNQTRGILCHGCNVMLGGARDKVSTLSQGAKYLSGEILYGYIP